MPANARKLRASYPIAVGDAIPYESFDACIHSKNAWRCKGSQCACFARKNRKSLRYLGRNPLLPAKSGSCSKDRIAHVISLSRTSWRWHLVRNELMRDGFSAVHHVRPVSTNDDAVLGMEREFGFAARSNGSPSPRAAISIMLTHAQLWKDNSLPFGRPKSASDGALDETKREWLYIFEDDVTFNADSLRHTTRAGPGAPSVARREDVQCVLDEVERLTPSKCKLIMLHLCLPMLPQTVPQANLRNGREILLLGNHTVRPCASMCTSAYAIRRSAASTFFHDIRKVHIRRNASGMLTAMDPFHRFSIDFNIRGYYFRKHAAVVPELEWPRCIDYPTYSCVQVSSEPHCGYGGLFIQNLSLPSQAEHDLTGHAWR
mmetsp:Transcript_46166/g.76327  ORF Transcript_46166/g.76327 Transcript_46166/m.76327 type:complete len:374 (+) Transcript_46166:180-1301(+)